MRGEPQSDRGAGTPAPRSTPLTIVSGAVAGDDLETVARTASDALGRPVAISIPALGAPVCWPAGAIPREQLQSLAARADDAIGGGNPGAPNGFADTIAVSIGEQIVGFVGVEGTGLADDERAWLEAGAAAAAVTALMRETREGGLEDSRRALLRALLAGPPADAGTFLAHARRLGCDLHAGAAAVAARGVEGGIDAALHVVSGTLIAAVAPGRLLGLVPLDGDLASVSRMLSDAGLDVAASAPRRDPAALHEALREAELMLELGDSAATSVAGQEETLRLLIGVLLRDREELEQLRAQTIAPLALYDAEHDTELLATLQAFLAHHGSTSETAEAMGLHRHTVGYRLARAHEVSGLSPHESDGRERLGLGLKAHQILEADHRLSQHE